MTEKNIEVLAMWGERLLNGKVQDSLHGIKTYLKGLKKMTKGETYTWVEELLESEIKRYNSWKNILDGLKFETKEYEIEFNKLMEEYKK